MKSWGVLGAVCFAGFVALLVVVPRLVPVASETFSAAAVAGYHTGAAFWAAALWSLVAMFAAAWFAARGSASGAGTEDTGQEAPFEGFAWGELLIVFAVFLLAYCPFFLARHGPYGEDEYFLAALHRMACGDLPYRDFAFLYGPLMIHPLWAWTQAFGLSMASHLGFLALVEACQFTLLMAVLQRFLPDRRQRYLAFALLLPFLFNTLLGLNWNGMRRLLPVLGLLLAAWRPFDRRHNAAAAALLGFALAYSHEYALAALFGVLGLYGLLWLHGARAAAFKAAAFVSLGTVLVYGILAGLALGATFPDYVAHAREVVGVMSSGHAAFPFYWTANSLALFGLLTLACLGVGAGMLRPSAAPFASGDRLLVAALGFALVTLKSGLTRADVWHLNAGFLALVLAALLPLPFARVQVTHGARRVAFACVVVASLTHLVGIAPYGSLYAASYLRGARDTLSGPTPAAPPGASRTLALEFERSEPREAYVALARYLAAPERRERPVLFYGRTWADPPMLGVCRNDYKLDDLMYTEFTRPEREQLRERPDTLVVMRRDAYQRIYELADPKAAHSGLELTVTKQLGRWLSTVHYDASESEARLQNEARARLLGDFLRERYRLAADFERFIVLSPNAPDASEPGETAEAGDTRSRKAK